MTTEFQLNEAQTKVVQAAVLDIAKAEQGIQKAREIKAKAESVANGLMVMLGIDVNENKVELKGSVLIVTPIEKPKDEQ